MKLLLKIFILATMFSSLHAQQRDESAKETYKFVDHLWYGIDIGGIGIGSNNFSAGFAPMGGYKINDNIAVGLISKLNYSYFWLQGGDSFHSINYGIGALTKIKFFRGKYFFQTEYDIMSMSPWNGFEQTRATYPFFYVGGGLNYPGNGKWSSTMSVLYNLHPDSNQLFFPLSISYAFLFNF